MVSKRYRKAFLKVRNNGEQQMAISTMSRGNTPDKMRHTNTNPCPHPSCGGQLCIMHDVATEPTKTTRIGHRFTAAFQPSRRPISLPQVDLPEPEK